MEFPGTGVNTDWLASLRANVIDCEKFASTFVCENTLSCSLHFEYVDISVDQDIHYCNVSRVDRLALVTCE